MRGSNLETSIVGIGLNVNQLGFPKELNATSLQILAGQEISIEQVLDQLNANLEKHYLRLRQGSFKNILSNLNRNLFGFEQQRLLTINGNEELVTVMGARPSGELQLQRADGRNTLHQHHEISWNLR